MTTIRPPLNRVSVRVDAPPESHDVEERPSAIAIDRGWRDIASLMQGRTSLTIAHRLITLMNCDVRLGVENGTLVRAMDPANQPDSPDAGLALSVNATEGQQSR